MQQHQHQQRPIDPPRTLGHEHHEHVEREHQQDVEHTPDHRLLHHHRENDIGQEEREREDPVVGTLLSAQEELLDGSPVVHWRGRGISFSRGDKALHG